MSIPIRILMIEDSEDDSILIIHHLEKAGYEPHYKRVDTAQGVEEALSRESWDIIISDYFMPQYDVLEALEAYRHRGLDIPFLVVSGTLGEEYAVNVIKKGAHDFLRKNNPARLVASVNRELRDAEERRALRRAEEEKKQMQQAIQISEERYSEIFNSVNDAIFLHDIDTGAIIDVNLQACEMYGRTQEEMLSLSPEEGAVNMPPYTRKEAMEWMQKAAGGEPQIFEWRARHKSGRLFWVEVSMKRSDIGGVSSLFVSVRDITARKEAENALREREEQLRLKLDSLLLPHMDLADEDLGNVIDTEILQSLMTDFYQITGMPNAILDLKGNILVAVGWQDICTKFHRINPETSLNCRESDLYLTQNVKYGDFLVYKCKNNLWEVVTPLYIGSRHVGNIFIGQFFYEDEVPDYQLFVEQAEKYGFDKDEYLAALKRVPRWSREKIATLIAFYSKLSTLISRMSYSNLMLARSITTEKRIAAELRESEEKMRAVVEASPVPILWAVEGKIEFINRKFVEIFGYTLEDIPTLEDWLLHTCPDFGYREAVRILWNSIMEEPTGKGGASSIEVSIACKDGNTRYVNMAGARIGSILLAIFSDLTERKRAEEEILREKEFSDAVIDTVPGLVYIFDDEGHFVRWSRNQEEVMGYTAEESSHITMLDVIAPEDRESATAVVTQVFSVGEASLEASLLTKDGRKIPYLFTGVRITREGKTYLLGAGMDISERKKAEEVTIKAMERAERASRAKSEFMAHMSHEIRTPMNGIIGLTTLLLNSELASVQREYLNMVKVSAGNLLGIINDILDLSRIEAHRIELVKSNFQFRETLAETLKMQKQFAEQKGLAMSYTISHEVPDALYGDTMKLHQVILNLISNAVKFTEKGHIDFLVEVERADSNGVMLHFSVSDTGCGIPESMQQDIFEPFTRGETSFTRTHDSVGLGLAICRDLVSLMGGTIWLESRSGSGSNFHFTVLLEEQKPYPEKAGEPPGEIEFRASSLAILIAEDEAINRRVIVDYLTSNGHKVCAVDNGKKVLEALEKENYDVVLMDIRMPVMNGLEATEIIRRKELETDRHQCIIAMTAYAMKDDLERFIQAGMDFCITKPLDMEDLDNVLHELSYAKTS
ncbi:MAG: PAS domain S-box protein [Vulcanimicrobiota bacterium]